MLFAKYAHLVAIKFIQVASDTHSRTHIHTHTHRHTHGNISIKPFSSPAHAIIDGLVNNGEFCAHEDKINSGINIVRG